MRMIAMMSGDLDWGRAVRIGRTLRICGVCIFVHRIWYKTLGINPTLSCGVSWLEVKILSAAAIVVGLVFFLTLLVLI
jgi:hypothetical protein